MFSLYRQWAGVVVLAVGMGALATVYAAAPSSPASAKALDADIAALNKLLNGGSPEKGAKSTIKPLALMIAVQAQEAGKAGTVAAAVKVAEAAAKKDWAGAAATAKTLATASGGAAPSGPIYKLAKFDLADVMSPFRLATKGGLNIEKDIRDAKKAGSVEPAAAELIGIRTAIIADFTHQFPNDKAAAGANAAKWKKYTDSMLDSSKKIVAEAGKGKGADQKALGKMMSGLEASCINCHNDFRD